MLDESVSPFVFQPLEEISTSLTDAEQHVHVGITIEICRGDCSQPADMVVGDGTSHKVAVAVVHVFANIVAADDRDDIRITVPVQIDDCQLIARIGRINEVSGERALPVVFKPGETFAVTRVCHEIYVAITIDVVRYDIVGFRSCRNGFGGRKRSRGRSWCIDRHRVVLDFAVGTTPYGLNAPVKLKRNSGDTWCPEL